MAENSLNVPNLDKLIAHLEAQPPEKFNMRGFYTRDGQIVAGALNIGTLHQCGTAACIAGHIYEINYRPMGMYGCARWLGLDPQETCDAELLFCPDGYEAIDNRERYPLWRAIATLKRLRDRFLATGEIVVDWGAEPGQEPAQTWSAPRAVEITPPALPETLTRLLAADRAPATEMAR